MYLLFLFLAAFIVIGIVVLACLFGNGKRETEPVDRFAKDVQIVNPPAPPVPLSTETVTTSTDVNKEADIKTPENEETEKEKQTETGTEAMDWKSVSILSYHFDEQKFDVLLYMFHRQVQRAILSDNNTREILVAEQNFKQAVWLLLQASLESVEPQLPLLSSEIKNAFDWFVERYCEMVVQQEGGHCDNNHVFSNAVPLLHEAFAQSKNINSEDAVWLTESISLLRQQMEQPSTTLAQQLFMLYKFYNASQEKTQIRFPHQVQKQLDKRNSRLSFVIQQSVRVGFDKLFPQLLQSSKHKQECILLLMSMLNRNLLNFKDVTK